MAKEIERKFAVKDLSVLRGRLGAHIAQGYVVDDPMTVRVRIIDAEAFLTLKSKLSGIVRDEYEFPIPMHHARELLERHCGSRVIEKVRYRIQHAGFVVEVDVYKGRHLGLVVAEVELDDPEAQLVLPEWLGEELTHDRRFANSALASCEELPVPVTGGLRQ